MNVATLRAFSDEYQQIMLAKEAGMFDWAGKKVHGAGQRVVKRVQQERRILKQVLEEMDKDPRIIAKRKRDRAAVFGAVAGVPKSVMARA